MLLIDIKQKIKKSFNAAVITYDTAAFIQSQAGAKLLGKLTNLDLSPEFIVDIGAGTGFLTRGLAAKYPASMVAHIDFAEAMLQAASQRSDKRNIIHINADFDQLPFASETINLIFSNFALQWSLNMRRTFLEFQRVLKPSSYCLFTTLGASTFMELHSCWQLIDNDNHVNRYGTLADIKQNLSAANLNIITIETEILRAYFPTVRAIMQNLKKTGANYVINRKKRTLSGKKAFKQLAHHYEYYQNEQGQLPLSYEIIYILARK